MDLSEKFSPRELSLRGTPRDYSTDMYRVYFEVGEHDGLARRTIEGCLGCEVAIQIVPEIMAALLKHNIGVYQVVRYAKTNSVWT